MRSPHAHPQRRYLSSIEWARLPRIRRRERDDCRHGVRGRWLERSWRWPERGVAPSWPATTRRADRGTRRALTEITPAPVVYIPPPDDHTSLTRSNSGSNPSTSRCSPRCRGGTSPCSTRCSRTTSSFGSYGPPAAEPMRGKSEVVLDAVKATRDRIFDPVLLGFEHLGDGWLIAGRAAATLGRGRLAHVPTRSARPACLAREVRGDDSRDATGAAVRDASRAHRASRSRASRGGGASGYRQRVRPADSIEVDTRPTASVVDLVSPTIRDVEQRQSATRAVRRGSLIRGRCGLPMAVLRGPRLARPRQRRAAPRSTRCLRPRARSGPSPTRGGRPRSGRPSPPEPRRTAPASPVQPRAGSRGRPPCSSRRSAPARARHGRTRAPRRSPALSAPLAARSRRSQSLQRAGAEPLFPRVATAAARSSWYSSDR